MAALYAVHFCNFLLPIITIAYLARILGPTDFAMVAFAQAFGMYVSLVIDYGFSLSATREVARQRGNPQRLAELFAGVVGAQMVLAAVGVAAALIVPRWLPMFRGDPALLWMGALWGLAHGWNTMWFHQGFERVQTVGMFDAGAKAFAAALTIILVRSPRDAWIVLALQSAAAAVASAVSVRLAYRKVRFLMPSPRRVWRAFRFGWAMFVFRGALSLYSTANVFLLGLFAPAGLTGCFAGAERIGRAPAGLLTPFTQAIYPRLSGLLGRNSPGAERLQKVGLGVLGASGIAMGAGLFLCAPLIISVVLGPGFEQAVPALRIMALLPPLITLNTFVGFYWVLPLGLDRAMVTVTIGAGLLNVAAALYLAPRFGHLGMAWATVLSELAVLLGLLVVLRGRRTSSCPTPPTHL